MKKLSTETLQKFLDTIHLEQYKRYYMRFIPLNFYLIISNEYINGYSDHRIITNELPTPLYYWEVLYILNIIIKYGRTDYLNLVEIGEF
jgi:hypothetical protein